MQLPPVEPGSNARTIAVAIFVAAAHLLLFSAYVTCTRSGMSGLREAHAVAPSGALEVVLLASPEATDRPAPAGPVLHAPFRARPAPAVRSAPARKPAKVDIAALDSPAAVPPKVVAAQPAQSAAGAAGSTAAAASAATAAKAPPAAEAARSSARPELKRADEVVCRIPTPAYPARARRLEEEGTAIVRMTLDTSGNATAVGLERGSGFPDLDAAALDAVRAAACEPYVERGQAVPVSLVQSIDFKLTGQ
jgi:protein TonB